MTKDRLSHPRFSGDDRRKVVHRLKFTTFQWTHIRKINSVHQSLDALFGSERRIKIKFTNT